MKVLVLGGTRFFGKRLVEKAVAAGHDVTVLTRGQSGTSPQGTTELKADRKDADTLRRALGKNHWDVVYDQICFNSAEAAIAEELFRERTGRYVFTSSMSVFPKGPARVEESFDPKLHPLVVGSDFEYAEGKRQAEAYLFQKSSLPTVSVRVPCVVGMDDYTRRVHFHVERTLKGLPIFFPVPNARVSLIQSEEAADFLLWAGTQLRETGLFNAAADGLVALNEMMALIGELTGKPPLLANEKSSENHSPYGVPSDIFMITEKAKSLGYRFSNSAEWFPYLLKQITAELQEQI
ncbi:MAG: NAD-dependent epimerase/dehydratase family protein [Bdellovibrionota bacterium]